MEYIHFGKLVFERAKKHADRAILKFKEEVTGEWKTISWCELAKQVRTIAKSLIELGV